MIQDMVINVLKLLLAAGIGFIVGAEREKSGKPAGMRTLALVCLGTAFITILTWDYYPAETPRVIAGILTGIGFLGAGTIIAHESNIIGLTTAATVWAVAIVGVAIGMGEIWLAVIFTLIAFIILVERKIEQKIIEKEKAIKTRKILKRYG